MSKNYTQLFLGIIIGLLLGVFIGKKIFQSKDLSAARANNTADSSPGSRTQKETQQINNPNNNDHSAIPRKVYDVLKYIRANHHAMPGYVGGRVFSNREKIVPQFDENGNRIFYQEWDVNPKIDGQNRGTERMVTGSDGRAWYTDDHYQSFKEIK